MPARGDLGSGAVREGDDGGGMLEQHRELRIVKLRVSVMRIAEVMDGDDQGDAGGTQRARHRLQLPRRLGVEAEVHVEDVERFAIRGDPFCGEHRGRPPATRNRAAVSRRDVPQPHHRIVAIRIAQVTDIDVAGRNRSDPDLIADATCLCAPNGGAMHAAGDGSAHAAALPVQNQPAARRAMF
jgi:hypothetical protein